MLSSSLWKNFNIVCRALNASICRARYVGYKSQIGIRTAYLFASNRQYAENRQRQAAQFKDRQKEEILVETMKQ